MYFKPLRQSMNQRKACLTCEKVNAEEDGRWQLRDSWWIKLSTIVELSLEPNSVSTSFRTSNQTCMEIIGTFKSNL
jgi:hypothetical protein